LPQEATLTTLSAVLHADRKRNHGSTATTVTAIGVIATATGPDAKCSPRYVQNAEKTPKFHSNPAKIARFIVAIAIVNSD
jgi:hypothetical protein